MQDTLCWQGPGPVYEVVSALRQGEHVKLLGQGSIPGWYVVENPIYHDPCWMDKAQLLLDPSINLALLQTFTPPATPIPTKVPTKVPTATGKP